jgi:hypothetical protein
LEFGAEKNAYSALVDHQLPNEDIVSTLNEALENSLSAALVADSRSINSDWLFRPT